MKKSRRERMELMRIFLLKSRERARVEDLQPVQVLSVVLEVRLLGRGHRVLLSIVVTCMLLVNLISVCLIKVQVELPI